MLQNDANLETVKRFYTCFQALDAAGMTACYHPDIVFNDPVFGTLRKKEAAAMWHMLIARGKDLTIRFSNIRNEDGAVRAHWEADYPFSRTGRQVRNVIEARFLFQDGLIVRHDDSFNLWRWQGMALGPVGALLGWSPPLRNKLRKTARQGLDDFIAKTPAFKN
jgi:ketosteroid isomerase-like protein